MPWLRVGDDAATHPLISKVRDLQWADGRLPNEVFGFVVRCAAHSAGHLTDGRIDRNTAETFGLSRWKVLVKSAVAVGLLIEHQEDGKVTHWQLLDDQNFLHIRSRDEVEWERQRRSDAANTRLTVPVRARDGDNCRYCRVIVNWQQRKGARAGTYDHREPGKRATVDTYVVACGKCNAARGSAPNADAVKPLLAAPRDPFYGPETAAFLTKNGRPTQATSAARSGEHEGESDANRGGSDVG